MEVAHRYDDSDDPVVAEVDVHLSKKLAEYLYLFQYPLYGEAQRPYDLKFPNLGCRIRPNQKKVEVDLPIDTTSPMYDQVKAEEIALLHLGEEPTEEKIAASMFPTGRMDKHMLSSTAAPIDTHYCVGVMDQSGLHLTPLSSIVQLRPSFHYLDPPDAATEDNDEANDEDEEEAVTVKVQTTRERKIAARKAAQAEPDEPWVPLHVYARSRKEVASLHKRLYCAATHDTVSFDTSSEQYVGALSATSPESAHGGLDADFSRASLHNMPLDQRVRSVLTNAQVVRLQALVEMTRATEDDLINILPDMAVLVHGNWVVRSEVLYPESYKSPVSGAPADVMRNARDFILCSLHSQANTRPDAQQVWRERPTACSRPQQPFRGVDASAYYPGKIDTHYLPHDPSQVPAVVKDGQGGVGFFKRSAVAQFLGADSRLSTEDIREMLKGVAVQVVSQGWAFKFDTDTDFIERYPSIVERQAELMRLRWQAMSASAAAPASTGGPARKSSLTHKSTPAAVGDTHNARAAIKALFEEKGVVTESHLRQFCVQRNITLPEMEAVLHEIAFDLAVEWWPANDKVYVLSADDPLRTTILGMFCASKTIKRKDAMDACKQQTGQELSTSAWNRIINSLADRKGAAWEFRLS